MKQGKLIGQQEQSQSFPAQNRRQCGNGGAMEDLEHYQIKSINSLQKI